MNTSLIWGTILILLGLSLICKSLFHISIPLVRPFIGCLFIYVGLNIMVDPFGKTPFKKNIIFGHSALQAQKETTTYNTVFGSSSIDLSHIKPENITNITVNALFGSSCIKLNPNIATKITAQAVFSRAELPDQSFVSFGRNTYQTTDTTEPLLNVQINAVFANVQVETS